MEGHWETERGAPLRIGGWPDEEAEVTRYAIEIPYGLSLLASPRPERRGEGAERCAPRRAAAGGGGPHRVPDHGGRRDGDDGGGAAGRLLAWRKRRLPLQRWYLWLVVLCGPLGFIAIEAGWTVTEVGRQPWVIYGVMRTADAVTPMPGLVVPFPTFTLLYVFLSVVAVLLLKRQVFASPRSATPHAGRTKRRSRCSRLIDDRRNHPHLADDLRPGGRGGLWRWGVGLVCFRAARPGAAGHHRGSHRAHLGGQPRLVDRGDRPARS